MQLETVELQEPRRNGWIGNPSPLSKYGTRHIRSPLDGLESSPLAPRRYRWLVWLGWGPYMQVEGTLGSTTLLDGYGGRNTFSSYPAQNYGSKKGSCGDRP